MCIHLEFNYKKAVQAISYFAIKEGGRIDKMKVIKLIYFADRYHMRKYNRPITNDEYFAMSYGPVASGVKDIAEMSSFLGEKEAKYAEIYLKVPDRNQIESLQSDLDTVFSKSDIEALDFAWQNFGHLNQFQLFNITHEYPDLKKHELKLKERSRIRMNYEDFFEDPPESFNKCHPLTDEEKLLSREHLKRLSHLESLWS
jgi:uncharacterized phage-associated protein